MQQVEVVSLGQVVKSQPVAVGVACGKVHFQTAAIDRAALFLDDRRSTRDDLLDGFASGNRRLEADHGAHADTSSSARRMSSRVGRVSIAVLLSRAWPSASRSEEHTSELQSLLRI